MRDFRLGFFDLNVYGKIGGIQIMKRLFVVVFAMVSSQFCFSQEHDFVYCQKQLQQYLDILVHDDQSIYNSVLLVETPSFTYKIASGYADPENKMTMHVDDQFFGASTTKMMIATIVMMLEEEGKIHLDDPITKYLEDSLVSGLHILDGVSYESKITIRHLLSHRSGLSSHWSEEFINLMIQEPMRFWHPHDVIQYVKENRPSQFIPGEGWSYSDLGYILLGLIIEKVTGMDLVDASRQLLFDSLNLNHTYWQFREKERPSIPGRGPSHCFREDMDYTFWRALSADYQHRAPRSNPALEGQIKRRLPQLRSSRCPRRNGR